MYYFIEIHNTWEAHDRNLIYFSQTIRAWKKWHIRAFSSTHKQIEKLEKLPRKPGNTKELFSQNLVYYSVFAMLSN